MTRTTITHSTERLNPTQLRMTVTLGNKTIKVTNEMIVQALLKLIQS